MKLTGELKDKVDKTESMVEKKDIIAQAGMELTDDELDMVTGGAGAGDLMQRLEEEMRKKFEEDHKRMEEDLKRMDEDLNRKDERYRKY